VSTDYCKISLKKLTGKQTRTGYHNGEFKKLFGSTKVDPRLPFTRSGFFQESRKKARGMSISGVQQKLSLKESEKHKLVATVEGGEYILKPGPEAYPCAAENEHAAMRVSQLLGIDTAQCCLVSFAGGELAYLTRRFDRQEGGGKLHQEDLMQCSDLPSDDKYSKTYEEAGKLVHKVTNGKQAAVLDFVRRVITAYVMGNDDLHLKNFSVQRFPGNTSHYYDKLTPNYDCLFCAAFNDSEAENTGMGLLALGLLHDPENGDEYFTDLYEYYGYYTGYDFLELAGRLDLPEKPIRTFMAKLKDSQKKIIELIDHSFMPDRMKARASAMVENRLRAIQILEK
jgi:serine/threonine-protein kinase HipA